MFSVGVCLSRGEGVRQNKKAALEWFRKAAEKGHGEAYFNVAYYFENGIETERDLRSAKKWYQRAVKYGDEDAAEALLRLGKLLKPPVSAQK
jgi:uncharacterized protein